MARTDRRYLAVIMKLSLLLVVLLMTGCASYHGKKAFEEAEQLAAEKQFDLAVEKYVEATENEPGKMIYQLKLQATRTRAAAHHIRRARAFAKEDQIEPALSEYRLARGFDPSIEVAREEELALLNRVEATEKADMANDAYRERRLGIARQLAQEALALDPQNTLALEILERLDKDRQTIAMDGFDLDVSSTEPITLRFKDAKIKEVFTILNQLTGINFILDEEIRDQSVSVLLEKASFTQAMELILQMNGLDKKVLNGKTIIIYPQSREKSKQYEDQIIQTFYLSHIDAKKAVNLLRTMLQLRKIYVHEERNAIVIRDKPQVVQLAEQILDAADRGDAEVLFDVEVLAVRDQDGLKFGPQLDEYFTNVGFSDPIGTITTQSLSSLQTFYTVPSATFDFAKALTSTELLASPKIRVKNNEKAKVHIGKRDPIVTTTNIGTSDSTTQNVQYVDSGIKLDIEPTIQLDGTVLTKITLEVSSAERLDADDTTGTSPVALTTTNAQTSLALIDGQRTILGGLYENNRTDNRSTIPFLGEIPFLGSLFTSFSIVEERREIILSITPYIVKKVDVPDNDVATIWSGGEDNLKAGPNFGSFNEALVSEIEATVLSSAPSLKEVHKAESMIDAEDAKAAADLKRSPGVEEPAVVSPGAEPEASDEFPVSEPLSPAPTPKPTELPPSTPVPGTAVEPAVETPEPGELLMPSSPEPIEPVPVSPAIPPQPEAPVVAPPVVPPQPEAPVVAPPATTLEVPVQSARLGLDGPRSVTPGVEFTVAVLVDDVADLYSAPLFVKYDPKLLDFVDAIEGTFLGQFGQTTVFSTSPNRTAGQVIVGYKQGVGGKGASGDGVLYSVKFKARTSGAAKVGLDRINFRDPKGSRLAVEPASMTIDIQ